MSEEYLTVAEAAEKLSVSPRTIQRYCKQGRLNYKWVHGKRHRELRIIPPIPVADLPGVKIKKEAIDFVTADEYRAAIEELKESLLEKDRVIEEIRREVERLKSIGAGGSTATPDDREILERAREIVHDFRKVRPVEKKLILKMAKEIEAHAEFLRSLGMDRQASSSSE